MKDRAKLEVGMKVTSYNRGLLKEITITRLTEHAAYYFDKFWNKEQFVIATDCYVLPQEKEMLIEEIESVIEDAEYDLRKIRATDDPEEIEDESPTIRSLPITDKITPLATAN